MSSCALSYGCQHAMHSNNHRTTAGPMLTVVRLHWLRHQIRHRYKIFCARRERSAHCSRMMSHQS
jgi:hypothetical protein